MTLRVGLIGARRTRQGLGPFVARDLRALGVEVPVFLATRESSIAPTQAALREIAEIEAAGFTESDAFFAEALDAVAILSPSETHEAHLARAAEAGVSVLCEKPLVWGGTGLAERSRELVERFAGQGLWLYENCQWPFTLPGFEALYPGAFESPPKQFRMQLQPVSEGLQALGDALSHPISVLQRALPGPTTLRNVVFSTRSHPDVPLQVRFDYDSGAGSCAVQIDLAREDTIPRRASLAFDGREARRVVEPESYRLSFAGSERTVPLDDPLTLLIADFVRCLGSGDETERSAHARQIVQRMELLEELIAAYAREEGL
ncbi:MAG: Gfo/Idh/MocA family oxidoreductase [Myxococcota bacterium]